MTPAQTSGTSSSGTQAPSRWREHRVGRQAAADPQVEAGAVLGVDDADEGDVVDLVHDVLQAAGDRGLELARQVGELRVADVALG